MSVKITPNGELVITMRCMGSPEEYLALKTSLVSVLASQSPDKRNDNAQYQVLNLLEELELDGDQVTNAFNPNTL